MEKVCKKTLLWLSDGPGLCTGYSTISRKLLNELVDLGWECHFIEHTGNHQTYKPGLTLEDGEVFKFTTWGSGQQPYCQDILQQRIKEIKPDVFGILLDTFMCYPWILDKDFAPAKTVFYFPSDGGGGLKDGKLSKGMGCNVPNGCELVLKKMDNHVAMSMFAREQVKEVHGIKTNYIPHAVEEDVYKPLPDQEKANLRALWGLQGKFIVGVVARNQGRKMLDRTLYAFAKIKDKMPNAVLLMHTDKFDPASYFNFDKMIADLGIENRIIFTGTKYYKGFDYKKMNEVYNLMDVFLLGTSGEGFGIPIIEAMSAGIPVLCTDYTTTWELVERNIAGMAVKKSGEILGTWNVGRALMDIDDCGVKLLQLYNDPELRKQYGQNGRNAVLREYTWKEVAKSWDKLLSDMIK